MSNKLVAMAIVASLIGTAGMVASKRGMFTPSTADSDAAMEKSIRASYPKIFSDTDVSQFIAELSQEVGTLMPEQVTSVKLGIAQALAYSGYGVTPDQVVKSSFNTPDISRIDPMSEAALTEFFGLVQ